MGVKARPVQIQNIVVGDLPVTEQGDFYLQIECANNPPMCSDVADDGDPLIVNFSQVFTLLVRDTLMEYVTFTVREMRVAGSVDLAEVSLHSSHIIQRFVGVWQEPGKFRRMRFQMDVVGGRADIMTPSWISFEIGYAEEWVGGPKYAVPLMSFSGADTGTYVSCNIKEFKTQHKLHDLRGHTIADEPPDTSEERDQETRKRRCRVTCCCNLLLFLGLWGLVYRGYLYKCWGEYELLAEVNKTGLIAWTDIKYPIPEHIVEAAEKHLDKTSEKDIFWACKNPPGPANDPTRPVAFNRLSYKYMKGTGVPCPEFVCHAREEFVRDRMYWWITIGTITAVFCCFQFCMPYQVDKEAEGVEVETATLITTQGGGMAMTK